MPDLAQRTPYKHFGRLEVAILILEVVQLTVSIATLGLTASAAQNFKNELLFPNIPTKLTYNLAIAAGTTLALLFLAPLDLFSSKIPFWENWNRFYSPWPRVLISLIFVFLWMGSVISSVYNCANICEATPGGFNFEYASVCCVCEGNYGVGETCNIYHRPRYFNPQVGIYEATQAMDALMLALVFATTCIFLSFDWIRGPLPPPEYEAPQPEPLPRYEEPILEMQPLETTARAVE